MDVFSARERAVLVALAAAALPAGTIFAGADAATVAKVELFFAGQASATRTGYRALLKLLDGAALLGHRRGFAALALHDRLALIEGWQRGGLARRSALRGLMLPLKIAHFDDPRFYRSLGCVYELPTPAPEARPAWFRERVHAGLDEDLAIECDVVVIGTGAGGAVAAKELAEAGVAVVMLEEGDYADRRDFARRPFVNQRALYRAGGATFSVGNVAIPIPLGRTVGGSTTINSGTCFRTPDRLLRRWSDQLGLHDLAPDRMAPYFERVEQILGVAPVPTEHLGGCAQVVMRGADKLGVRHRPLQRNAPGCDGQGMCCFGCPTDAKRSTNVSYVPMALRAGAELFTGARVTRIVVEDGRASGVVAVTSAGRTLTVRARAVVVACGALLTPVLLMRNRLGAASGQLGRNLSIHPAVACLAELDASVASWRGVPQSYSIDEWADDGILMEGVATPLEYCMSVLEQVGPRLIELAEGYDRVASFGMMVADTSRGRVRLIGDHPVVHYDLNRADVARLKRGIDALARVFFAAGARTVLAPVHGFDELRGEADLARLRAADVRAHDLNLSGYHPLGTARMGRDPTASVVDADHQVHDLPGLHIVDGSAVPTALGVNPQVTIMALATRAADRLAARLS